MPPSGVQRGRGAGSSRSFSISSSFSCASSALGYFFLFSPCPFLISFFLSLPLSCTLLLLERLRAPPGAPAFCVAGEDCLLSFCLAFSLPLVAHYSERDTEGGRERESARAREREERREKSREREGRERVRGEGGRERGERRISQVICSCSESEEPRKAGKMAILHC